MEKILFIDRDGTLVAEPSDEQVDRLDKIDFESGVIPALLSLLKSGYKLVMVSNQDGLGTESFPQEDFDLVHNFIMNLFASQGVQFEEVLICPHFSHENCACRKPKTGLVQKYLDRDDWDRTASYVIGDRLTDVKLAENMGIAALQYHRQTLTWPMIAKRLTEPGRHAIVERNTKETQIRVEVDLDGKGKTQIDTGVGFFDHMLEQIATHGAISLDVKVRGDLQVDEHHTVEDVGLALGEAIKKALGNKRGIRRFGFVAVMDEVKAVMDSRDLTETLIPVALDISGRPWCKFECDASFVRDYVGTFPVEMVPHFFQSLSYAMGLTLHMKVGEGNTHHQVEALFKCFGRALRDAKRIEGSELPSSKGVL